MQHHLLFSPFYPKLNCVTSLNIKCSFNLPFKSFASLGGLCLKSGAIRISTAGDAAAAAAHYQHPSSSDMLWRLALCCCRSYQHRLYLPFPFPRSDQRRGAKRHVRQGMNAACNGVYQRATQLSCLFEHTQQAE